MMNWRNADRMRDLTPVVSDRKERKTMKHNPHARQQPQNPPQQPPQGAPQAAPASSSERAQEAAPAAQEGAQQAELPGTGTGTEAPPERAEPVNTETVDGIDVHLVLTPSWWRDQGSRVALTEQARMVLRMGVPTLKNIADDPKFLWAFMRLPTDATAGSLAKLREGLLGKLEALRP